MRELPSGLFACNLDVQGTLDAVGTTGSPITFTSLNDNSIGGTTGSGSPAAGDWGGIYVDGSGNIDFEHANVDYASFTYGRDNNGQASSQSTTGMPGSSSVSYSYNPLSELSAAGSSSYSYDSAQNLVTAPNGDNQKFNADTQVCWQGSGTSSTCTPPSGAMSYAYSDQGNRTSMTPSGGSATTYGWNQLNQLTGFTPTSGSATSYAYDNQGLLTESRRESWRLNLFQNGQTF